MEHEIAKIELPEFVNIENDEPGYPQVEENEMALANVVHLRILKGYESNSEGGSTVNPLSSAPSCEKQFKCDECGMQFAKVKVLRSHMAIHNGKKKRCELCSKEFTRSFDLTTHMRTHTGEKPFQCMTCAKTFTRRSALNQHEKIHESKAECEYCGAVFHDRARLEKHVLRHTQDKPYKCQVCQKGFSYSSSYKAHLKLHNGERHECEFCYKVFASVATLRVHVRIHTGEKPYQCVLCKMTFQFRKELIKHVSDECELRNQVGYRDNVSGIESNSSTSKDCVEVEGDAVIEESPADLITL